MNTLLIILVILIIIVLPIPINFTLHYYKNSIHFYLYKKEIIFKKRVSKKVSYNIKSTDYIGLSEYYFHTAKNLHYRLKRNKFRPKLTLLLNFNIGLDDAARTAILFGILHSFSPAIYIATRNYFKIKKYKFSVNPDYDNPKFEIQIKSIIWISIVNTIYILLLCLYTFHKGKRIKAVEERRKSNLENNFE